MSSNQEQCDPGIGRSEFAIEWDAARTVVFAQILAGIGSYHDAEDMLQEVAISLAKNYDKYDSSRPFVNWALGFARYHILRYYNNNPKNRRVLDDSTIAMLSEQLPAAAEKIAGTKSEVLFECLKRLDSDRRQAVELRYAKDLPIKDISARMGMTVAAVNSLLHRTRAQLKICIERRQATQS